MQLALSSTGSNVFAVASRSRPTFAKRVMQAYAHSWADEISARLGELINLPKNWNGYGGEPVAFHVAHFAMNLLQTACPLGTKAPQVVPGGSGDLQIEWHTLEYDIELHVTGPFKVAASRSTGDDIEEVALTNEFSVVADWLTEMESKIAARRAAN